MNFMCVKFGDLMSYRFEDMIDTVKSQNGVQMTSRLSDQAEKLIMLIPGMGPDSVEIWF